MQLKVIQLRVQQEIGYIFSLVDHKVGIMKTHRHRQWIHFLNFLGNYIASAILHLGAKQAVYICGGITPRLQKYLPQSAFFDRITHHDRFSDFIAHVPVYLVQDNASGLRGSAVALDNPACAHRRI